MLGFLGAVETHRDKVFIAGAGGLLETERTLKKGGIGNGFYGVRLRAESLGHYGVLGLEKAWSTCKKGVGGLFPELEEHRSYFWRDRLQFFGAWCLTGCVPC